jgi:ribosomal protein S18 acetylase RimI-like enzyme
MLTILQAETGKNLELARNIFKEYAASLDFDLDFQDFEEELSDLPGQYASPEGCLLVAMYGDRPSGCIISHGICEMKRLYVKPQFRGLGIGRALAEAIIEEAREIKYARMRLDTVPSMEKARALYVSLGFKKIRPYRYNPIPGSEFMELSLLSGIANRRT